MVVEEPSERARLAAVLAELEDERESADTRALDALRRAQGAEEIAASAAVKVAPYRRAVVLMQLAIRDMEAASGQEGAPAASPTPSVRASARRLVRSVRTRLP